MKKLLSFVIVLLALSCCLSAQNRPNKPLSIDDWSVEQNEVTESGFQYDIHFSITNTTDSLLQNYAVTFKADTCKEEPTSLPAVISGLKPFETGHYIVSVRPVTSRDESISGHLEDASGRTMSPTFDLRMNNNPLFVITPGTISCLFTKADTVAHRAHYIFRAFVQNKTSETSGRIIYVQCGDNICKIPADSLKPDEKRIVSAEISVPEGKHRLFAYDSRKIALCDTMILEVPAEEEYTTFEPFVVKSAWKTSFVIGENGDPSVFMGDSLHAGIQNVGIGLYSGNPSSEYIWPDAGMAVFTVKDVYGRSLYLNGRKVLSSSNNLKVFLSGAKYSDGTYEFHPEMANIDRGGDYVFDANVAIFGYHKNDTLRVYDEPTIRYSFKSDLTIGDKISFEADANTGYPYADSIREKDYVYQYEVVYIKPRNGKAGGDTLRNWRYDSQVLNFNVERYPRLAGVDTVKYFINEPDLGEYLTLTNSNFKSHSKIIAMKVKDTVRMETKLTRESFREGIDTMATIHYKIDYKWPYISKNKGDSCPVVRLYVEHHNDSIGMSHEDSLLIKEWFGKATRTDTLRADSLIKARTYKLNVVNDSLLIQVPENTFLDLEGDFTFNISQLKAGEISPVNFTVHFDGRQQKNEIVGIRVKRIGTDDETIKMDDTTEDGPVYDLMGRRMTDEALPRGIYIRNGKKYLVL